MTYFHKDCPFDKIAYFLMEIRFFMILSIFVSFPKICILIISVLHSGKREKESKEWGAKEIGKKSILFHVWEEGKIGRE